ncbi:glycosyltransferase family 25 protein [Histophilus somni]|uniref:glycosyltransferase family 25 protein n=1 Tax=Histophilus somni TaxID=731 RepID=UPI00094AD07F|nr:glycosyltransferase family 25 protein [Histophilus somni]
MFNYVISLKSSIERRKHIEKEFGKQNIPYSFFDAFQPNEENENTIQQYVPSLNKTDLTIGEKGCLMSHVLLWQKCVDENLPFIAIFEDDIFLSSVANKFLCQYNWLKERFDFNQYFILRLETQLMQSIYKNTEIQCFQHHDFIQLMSSHWGTAGYIISQLAAKKLLGLFKSPNLSLEPIDVILFESLLKEEQYPVYQLDPALLVQDFVWNKENCQLTSILEPDRSKRKIININEKEKRNLWQKIQREIWRYKRRKLLKEKGYRLIKFYKHNLRNNK